MWYALCMVIEMECSNEYCCEKLTRQAGEIKKNKTGKFFCCRKCYDRSDVKAQASAHGRPRKRAGGRGLPPNPQPETLAVHAKTPVISWFEDRGYILLYIPDYRFVNKDGRIYEHRLVVSEHLDRRLGRLEHVDHIQPVSQGGGNSYENLQLMSASDHGKKTRSESPSARFLALVDELGITVDEALDRVRND